MHKLEKLILESYSELLNEMDSGKLFDYLNTKYHVKDHFHSDNSFMVTRRSDTNDQYVIFDFDKDKNQFYIRQLGGYSIDDAEAGEAGMNGKGGSRIAGIESYYTDGNYSPEEISPDALKKIVDHVMGGLDREAAAQRAFYAKRGRTSGTIDEMAKAEMEKKAKSNVLQWEELTDKQRAGIVKRYGEPMFNGEHDFFSSNMETYFKTYSKNKETGQIGHKVIKLPSFGSLYRNFSDIIADIKKLMGSDDIRTDQAAREFFELTKTNFRKLQRYLRTERPEQYNMLKMQRMMEGIETSFSKIEEKLDMNDPVLMRARVAKMRADDMKKLDAYKKSPEGRAAARAYASGQRKEEKAREIVRKLKIKRAQIEREMENDPDIEPQGGPVADMYGDQLNKIDNAIEKAASVYNKPMDYDTAVGKVNEEEGHLVTFGYDLDRIEDVVKHLQSKYKEGQDFELHIGRGDDLPNAVTLKNPALEKDHDLNDMLNAAQSDQDRYDAYTDYDQRRREEDDYYEDPDYYKESKLSLAESLLDDLKEEEEPEPEEEGDEEAPKDTVLEDATDQILAKFPTLTAAIIKLQTEDFKEFVDSIDWISPRPTEFRINLKNGQDYIMKWTGTGFEAQIMGKRFYIDKITDYQQALDKLAILYKEGPMTGAGEGEPADVDSGGSSGGGGGDFPGDDAGGGGGDDVDALGGDDAGADDAGGADLTGEPVDFEEPAEEPEA